VTVVGPPTVSRPPVRPARRSELLRRAVRDQLRPATADGQAPPPPPVHYRAVIHAYP
jgi:hypothetical protein